jgi:hypothetical protein
VSLSLKYGTETEAQNAIKDKNVNFTNNPRIQATRKWQSYNLSEWQAYRWMEDNKALVVQADQLYTQIQVIQNTIPPTPFKRFGSIRL